MRSCRLALLCLSALIILCAPCTVHAQPADCALPATGSPEQRSQCAINHADFLYWQICQARTYCASQDPGLLAAYATAADLFQRARAVQISNDAENARYFGALEERAHHFGIAANAYLRCTEIAQRTNNNDLGAKCTTRYTVVSCATNPTVPACHQAGPVNVTIIQRRSSGGGRTAAAQVDSVLDADDEKLLTSDPTNRIQMPSDDDVNTLRQSMSPQERKAAVQVLKDQQIVEAH